MRTLLSMLCVCLLVAPTLALPPGAVADARQAAQNAWDDAEMIHEQATCTRDAIVMVVEEMQQMAGDAVHDGWAGGYLTFGTEINQLEQMIADASSTVDEGITDFNAGDVLSGAPAIAKYNEAKVHFDFAAEKFQQAINSGNNTLDRANAERDRLEQEINDFYENL